NTAPAALRSPPPTLKIRYIYNVSSTTDPPSHCSAPHSYKAPAQRFSQVIHWLSGGISASYPVTWVAFPSGDCLLPSECVLLALWDHLPVGCRVMIWLSDGFPLGIYAEEDFPLEKGPKARLSY
ncbi:hypothetical protein STEG23_003745, partial [Scotinomys teguina]